MKKNIIAIIQARMGATRLPGKPLAKIDDKKTILKYMVDRVRKATLLNAVIIATTTSPLDDTIVSFCNENSILCFRGSEKDVLSRYYECANQYNADIIVRLTGDCPLIDPLYIDKTIALLENDNADFTSNTVPPATSFFPDGSDVEVFTMAALERAQKECNNDHDREHVTFYFWRYDNGFKCSQLKNEENYSDYRITVDYPEDLEVAKYIVKTLAQRSILGNLSEIVGIIDADPEIKKKNSKYYFGIGWEQ